MKNNQIDEGLSYLKEAEDIYECTYGLIDKKTCKIKWDIALLYLKASRYNEALDEVLAVEEQEKSLYGDSSLQVGWTYKLIGTLYILRR